MRDVKPNGSQPSCVASDPSSFSEDLRERAGRFCERYAELHEKHCKGAKYLGGFKSGLGGTSFDFQEALALVQTWDDARLDKLAHAFLVTDDEWVASGSRTLARFRSRASWCDERLRERGQ
jgi:hypothetical protein